MWAFDLNCLKPPNGCCFHEPVVFINAFNPHKSSALNHPISAPSSMPFISNFDFSYPKCHVFESHCRYQRIQSSWLLGWFFSIRFFLFRLRDRHVWWRDDGSNAVFCRRRWLLRKRAPTGGDLPERWAADAYSPFWMVCSNFHSTRVCKLCLFLFAQFIVPYPLYQCLPNVSRELLRFACRYSIIEQPFDVLQGCFFDV